MAQKHGGNAERTTNAYWRGQQRRCAKSRHQPVPETKRFGRVRHRRSAVALSIENARRRNDRNWGHCSATCGSYYTAMRIIPKANDPAETGLADRFLSMRPYRIGGGQCADWHFATFAAPHHHVRSWGMNGPIDDIAEPALMTQLRR